MATSRRPMYLGIRALIYVAKRYPMRQRDPLRKMLFVRVQWSAFVSAIGFWD